MRIKYVTMAYRNLWRNKRRTLITISSIVFSVLFAVYTRSMQEGSYDSMIDTLVKFYSGYFQIQDSAYWNERTLDNSIEFDSSLASRIMEHEDVLLVTPRLESFALSASKEKSKPVLVMGINPSTEDRIIKLSQKVKKGKFITDTDSGVLISEGLARYLELGVGDTIVMISQGYQGVSAAGKFAVRSIFRHPSPELNNRAIFMSLPAAQEFYSAPGKITAEVLMVKDHYRMESVDKYISGLVDPGKRIMSWEEMQPEMKNMIEGDRAGGIIMLWILYLVIGFGIFGTAVMMINERRREFGVLNAIGMKKTEINIVVFIETLLLGLIGVIAGMIVTFPVVYYFYLNPIPLKGDMAEMMMEYGIEPYMYCSIRPEIFLNQAGAVFIMCLIVGFISMLTIYRMKMINALRA